MLTDNIFSESMAKGDFDNLKGSGKPLPERRASAHVITDFTRHKVGTLCYNTLYGLCIMYLSVKGDRRSFLCLPHNFKFLIIMYRSFRIYLPKQVNEIIADSGFAPEWVMLRKDILAFRSRLRDIIRRKSDKRQLENRER